MTKLNEILNVSVLDELIEQGYISRKTHNHYPLAILNYTPMAQYDPKLVWGPEMNLSRGLVFNTTNMDVIARPFSKFWNLGDERHPETLEQNLPNEIPLFLEKLDGSMGVLFEWDGWNHVATRGSFHSDQAVWATAWLRQNYPLLKLPKENTIVSEVIYKENKIVVDYDYEGLVVLGFVNIATGREKSRSDVKNYCDSYNLQIVKEYDKSSPSDVLTEDEKNREGYVLTFPSTGLKVKVKFEEYCQLHKILTGLNVHGVWELLRDGKIQTIDEWMQDGRMPESFKKWVNGVKTSLEIQFDSIKLEVECIYANRPQLDKFMPYKESRKQMAVYFTHESVRKYSGLLFGLLDGKNIDESIWKLIEPSGKVVFMAEGE